MTLKEQSRNKFNNLLDTYESFSSEELYESLEFDAEKAKILKLSDEILGTKFKIGVIGEFSTGKSTLINSIIQRDLLPAKYKPTTNQITIIKDSKTEYVRLENNIESSLELSKENIALLDKKTNSNIEIGVKLSQLNDYEIFDTPGVNDPSMFSDEIVFDLIGEVDIVIFVMHATQVLKHSEIDFLTKLIRKKDIEKFFFIINQVDIIEDEKYVVRDDFLDKLSHLLQIERSKIASQTFLYSAKNALKAIENHDKTALRESGNDSLIEGIESYIKENKKELFSDVLKRESSLVVKNSLLKIDTIYDKLDDKDREYALTLKNIEQEIEAFSYEIEDAVYDFKKDFNLQKDDFKRSIEESFSAITNNIVNEIANVDVKKLTEDRYIEIRTKKLIEDATDEAFQKFSRTLKVNFENLNSVIEPVYNQKNIMINNLTTKNYASTIVSGLAIGGAVVGTIAYLPSILTIGAVGIGISAVGSVMNAIPVIGGMGGIAGSVIGGGMQGAVSTAGVLLMNAGEIAFNLAQWGVKGIGAFANQAEDILKVKQYQSTVKVSVEEIKKSILLNIDKEMQPETYIEAFLNEKFPQKDELKLKIEESKREFQYNLDDSEKIKAKLENIKLQLIKGIQ